MMRDDTPPCHSRDHPLKSQSPFIKTGREPCYSNVLTYFCELTSESSCVFDFVIDAFEPNRSNRKLFSLASKTEG